MAFNLVVTYTAELDIEKAVDWYNSKQEALGQRFYNAVLSEFAIIQKHPNYYSFYSKGFRKNLVKQFPYLIIFKITNQDIIIYTVIYGGRNPEIINKRMA